jgi:hypothetical protein
MLAPRIKINLRGLAVSEPDLTGKSMIDPIELRLRAKALGLSLHQDLPNGRWVLAKRIPLKHYVSASERNATLDEIAAELIGQEAVPRV